MDVVHDVPETWSDERMHVLDDRATCWCRPLNEVIDGRLLIRHRGGAVMDRELGGLAEVATLVDRPRPVVSNWNSSATLDTPAPLFRLAATPVWDLADWRGFGHRYPELMGPAFDPFAV